MNVRDNIVMNSLNRGGPGHCRAIGVVDRRGPRGWIAMDKSAGIVAVSRRRVSTDSAATGRRRKGPFDDTIRTP